MPGSTRGQAQSLQLSPPVPAPTCNDVHRVLPGKEPTRTSGISFHWRPVLRPLRRSSRYLWAVGPRSTKTFGVGTFQGPRGHVPGAKGKGQTAPGTVLAHLSKSYSTTQETETLDLPLTSSPVPPSLTSPLLSPVLVSSKGRVLHKRRKGRGKREPRIPLPRQEGGQRQREARNQGRWEPRGQGCAWNRQPVTGGGIKAVTAGKVLCPGHPAGSGSRLPPPGRARRSPFVQNQHGMGS